SGTVGTVTTIDNKQRNADGSIAAETQESYDSSTKIDTTSFDNDGDGVWDRIQTTDRSVAGTVTVTDNTNAGVLIDKTQTVTNRRCARRVRGLARDTRASAPLGARAGIDIVAKTRRTGVTIRAA